MYSGACGFSQIRVLDFNYILCCLTLSQQVSLTREIFSFLNRLFFKASHCSLSMAERAASNVVCKLQMNIMNFKMRKGPHKQRKIFGIPVKLIHVAAYV